MPRLPRLLASLASLTVLALVSSGCRGDDGGDDDGTPDAPVGDDMRIQDVQSDATMVETAVTLRGVVVVGIDAFGDRSGNFYVMEPGGGEYSGVLVFGATREQVAALAVGDLVDISGALKDEYSQPDDTATVTELIPASMGSLVVTKVGTGTVPAPQVVDALRYGAMTEAQRIAEYEKWEGVLIQVTNVSVTGNVRQISGSMPDLTFRKFDITGQYVVDSSLAEIPIDPPYVTRGECLASVTGMGDYFYDYKVLPRTTTDIVKGGAGCPPAETACTDGMDNDANGFVDCLDFSCTATEPTCRTATTIAMIQAEMVTGSVVLNDVVVTALGTGRASRGFWISDAAQAAANQGIFVFTGDTTQTVTVGQIVDVAGTVDEFDFQPPGDTVTQIESPTVTPATGTATPLPLEGIAIPTLMDIGTPGEPYEGVLVTLSNLRVMSTASGDRATLTNGTTTIVMDDDILDYAVLTPDPPDPRTPVYSTGTCFSTVTGIMSVNIFDDQRRLLPRTTADLTTIACP